MGNVVKFIPKEERCSFCGKQATLLCDMPSMSIVTSIDFKRTVFTCDKNICKDCTTRVGEFDYCPDCVKKIKLARKGVPSD